MASIIQKQKNKIKKTLKCCAVWCPFYPGNQLTSLDVSQNTFLVTLSCNDNQLTTLNVKNGNNTQITWFVATDNPNLRCILVDSPSWSLSNWSAIDSMAFFTETCDLSNDETLSLKNKLSAYPNPANGKVTIDLNRFSSIVEIKLFNSLGQLILSQDFNNTKQVSFEIEGPEGIYFLRLNTYSGKSGMIKIIKE